MSKIDFGFSKENTPSPEVQEFYRMQGEARAEERIIKLLNEYPSERMPGHPNTCEC
jgi:hypothetical protein